MLFELPKLPYAINALEPHISQKTLEFHYGKHHQGYVSNLNKLITGTEYEGLALEKIIAATAGQAEKGAIFNNAAQIWNHSFYWQSLTPKGGGEPPAALKQKIEASFGSVDACKKEFGAAALSQFGSGWAWLTTSNNQFQIVSTANQDFPISLGQKPILGVDVWEHAYYLKHQNRKDEYLKSWWNIINWREVEENLKKETG